MRIRRLAAVAVVASAAFAPAANAQSILPPIIEPLMNGCYGVLVTVCDPHVNLPVGTTRTPVPVCVGSCQTYSVPVPGLNGEQACVGWTDHTGAGTEYCTAG